MPAVLVLALLALRHYAWPIAPAEHQALVWNALGAVVIVVLLFAPRPSKTARLALIWWACEEALVFACSAAYIVRPWHVPDGEAMCSSLLGFDLGLLGICVVICLLAAMVRKHEPSG